MPSLFRSIFSGLRRKKGHMDPPHHDNPSPSPEPIPNPDLTTITTTIAETHSPVTRSIEQAPVVLRSSTAKPAVGSSSNTGAGLNALKSLLAVLGNTPLPGIGAVTTTLLHVIKHVEEIPQVEAGWEELAERMARLTFLTNQISVAPELQDEMEKYCAPLNTELGKLSEDIDGASKQGTLVSFFNSTDALSSVSAHEKRLDTIVNDLTMALCIHTAMTKVELGTQLDQVVLRLREQLSKASPASDEATIDMTGNSMLEVLGSVASNNQLPASARMKMSNNSFLGKVHGSVLSGNKVGAPSMPDI